MKRILLMVFRNLWFVPWAWCKLCYRASHTDKYTEEEQYSFIRWVDLHANTGREWFYVFPKPSGSV